MGPEVLLLLLIPALAGKKKRRSPPGWWDKCDFADYGPSTAKRIRKYVGWMYQAADEWDVDPDMIAGIVTTESNWTSTAHSSVGAMGLMQIMPGTAEHRSHKTGIPNKPWDPKTNLRLGCAGIASYLEKWGNYDLAFASYFAGAGAVQRYIDTNEWPQSVLNYVDKVKKNAQKFRTQRLKC